MGPLESLVFNNLRCTMINGIAAAATPSAEPGGLPAGVPASAGSDDGTALLAPPVATDGLQVGRPRTRCGGGRWSSCQGAS